MLYAILCYNDQDLVANWTPAEDAAVMANLSVVHDRLYAEGKLGPAGRLGFTGSAKTLVKGQEPPVVMDGPYAETKEAMLGFYVVDCASMDEALDVARAGRGQSHGRLRDPSAVALPAGRRRRRPDPAGGGVGGVSRSAEPSSTRGTRAFHGLSCFRRG
ncbi:YciI family protein [Caulobacter flavus]|uniref:YciI family protein n=1 Tax=Caulobacter flavus TaxID=1679497 RepID=UPI0026BA1690